MAKVSGGADIARALKQVTISLTTPITQASTKALKPVLAKAKADVPVRTGALRDALTIKKDPMARKDRPTFQVGPDSSEPAFREAHLLEFGTAPHFQPELNRMHPGAAAHPFLGPALEAKANEVVEILGREIGPAIERAAQRAAKRAARKN